MQQCLQIITYLVFLTGWYALMLGPGLPNSAEHSLSPSSIPDGGVSTFSRVFPLASLLEDSRWHLVQCDETPTVQVGTVRGYRVVLEYVWSRLETDGAHDQPTIRQAYQQLIFVPGGQPEADHLDSRISWTDFTQDPPEWIEVEGPLERVDMGTVDGFHVYGYMTIPQQEMARRQLGTTGGDDRLSLLENRLAQCQTDYSYLRTARLIAGHGNVAVPILKREIERSRTPLQYSLIKSLVRIPGPESAELILSLYSQDELRNAVAYALDDVPYRSDVEGIYLDYLQRNYHYALLRKTYEGAVTYGPDEVIPLLEGIRQAPHTILHYTTASRGLRVLRGNPFPSDLEKAAVTLRVARSMLAYGGGRTDRAENARRELLNTADTDAAIVLALELAVADDDGGLSTDGNWGVEILRQLPRDEVIPVLANLTSATIEEDSRMLALEILNQITDRDPAGTNRLTSSDI